MKKSNPILSDYLETSQKRVVKECRKSVTLRKTWKPALAHMSRVTEKVHVVNV